LNPRVQAWRRCTSRWCCRQVTDAVYRRGTLIHFDHLDRRQQSTPASTGHEITACSYLLRRTRFDDIPCACLLTYDESRRNYDCRFVREAKPRGDACFVLEPSANGAGQTGRKRHRDLDDRRAWHAATPDSKPGGMAGGGHMQSSMDEAAAGTTSGHQRRLITTTLGGTSSRFIPRTRRSAPLTMDRAARANFVVHLAAHDIASISKHGRHQPPAVNAARRRSLRQARKIMARWILIASKRKSAARSNRQLRRRTFHSARSSTANIRPVTARTPYTFTSTSTTPAPPL